MKRWHLVMVVFLGLVVGCRRPTISAPAQPEQARTEEVPAPVSVPHPVTPLYPGEDAQEPEPSDKEEVEDHSDEFAIHLVNQEVPMDQLAPSDMYELELEMLPILTQADILAYSQDTHEMVLTSEAYARLAQLEERTIREGGVGFVACVGEERIYTGAFWSSLSSAIFDGAVIDIHAASFGQPLTIQLGYPNQEWFTGQDSRSDARIFDVLMDAGVLN